LRRRVRREKMALKAGFLIFLAASSWQDARKGSIHVRTFQAAGAIGILLRLRQLVMWVSGAAAAGEAVREEILAGVIAFLLSLLPGLLLLGLSAATREAIGRGDGLFFLVSGIYLGLSRNLLLFGISLLLCFPVSLLLFIKGIREGRGAKNVRLPFLPFVVPGGIGVIFL
jgi:leader peptidase (prepilin peptidase)/N-methyltransferase